MKVAFCITLCITTAQGSDAWVRQVTIGIEVVSLHASTSSGWLGV